MLDLDRVDLAELAEALEDNSPESSWWIDPATGAIEPWTDWSDTTGQDHPEDRGLTAIEPIGSRTGYGDMEDFIARVRDPRARDLLERAIAGRGAFRRFKDTLIDFPDLREAWFRFHDARMARRAIEWLVDEDLVEPGAAERALAGISEPDLGPALGRFDPVEVAEAVARDLARLYGERLREVVLFGSWARGDAHPESDIDLLVVLDRVESPWEELRRMDGILWERSLKADTVVTALVAPEHEWRQPKRPTVIRAKAEGRRVA